MNHESQVNLEFSQVKFSSDRKKVTNHANLIIALGQIKENFHKLLLKSQLKL